MSAKSDYLSRVFSEYLDRRSVPQHLQGKEKAQADEFSALIRAVVKSAPDANYQEWWPRMEDAIDSLMRTRVWPVVNEIRAASKLVAKGTEKGTAVSLPKDPVSINARRIKAGEAVSDSWVFGRLAVDLISSGQIDEGDLAPYRSSLFFAEKNVTGEDTARQREAERRHRHDEARRAVGLDPFFVGGSVGFEMTPEPAI